MQCPACNSDNVQKLSVVYESGTQNIKTRGKTYGSGVGVGRGGLGVGFGSATTTTTGKSQSIAAQKAAPPNKKPMIWPGLLVVAGAIAIFAMSATLVGIAMIAIGGFLLWNFNKYNTQVYPPKFDKWQSSWLCNKCGTIFTT